MQTFKYTIILILSILLISGCNARDKKVEKLSTNNQNETKEKEITRLISNLKIVDQKLNSLSQEKSMYKTGDPEREKIEKEYDSLHKQGYEILTTLFKIGKPVIPYAREMLRDKNTMVKIFGVLILGEVSKNLEKSEVEEVVLDLLSILPFTERESSLAVMGALFKIGKPAIPYIINQLNNEDEQKRIWSFELLKQMTMERFNYYKPEVTDLKERQKAIEMIKDWWKKNKDSWKVPEYKNN